MRHGRTSRRPASASGAETSSACALPRAAPTFSVCRLRPTGHPLEVGAMELPGANFLYALATISVTFVGFSALLLVFRETIGGRMTGYDSYFALSFMQAG